MKQLSLIITILLFVIVNTSCKKNKPTPINTKCGCDATEIKFQLTNQPAKLVYYEYKNQWCFSVNQSGGFISVFFPCNQKQDSLQKILHNATQNQEFQVKVSGKVKYTCPNEDFGFTTGSSSQDYIVIDSLKRN